MSYADYYRFTVSHDSVAVPDILHQGVTFDIDYADGIAGPNTVINIFEAATGRLVLTSTDSNVADDQPNPFGGTGVSDLRGGSAGVLDPFIGSANLPEGDYIIAVTSDAVQQNQLLQTQIPNPPNTQVRGTPMGSLLTVQGQTTLV